MSAARRSVVVIVLDDADVQRRVRRGELVRLDLGPTPVDAGVVAAIRARIAWRERQRAMRATKARGRG